MLDFVLCKPRVSALFLSSVVVVCERVFAVFEGKNDFLGAPLNSVRDLSVN